MREIGDTRATVSAPRTMTLNVLIVDDNRELADNLAELLIDEGHRVATANSGEQALQIAANQRFDYVLTDFRMPEMNGVELITRLHARDPAAIYLLMTAHAGDALLTAETGRGVVDAILGKPLPIDRLLALIFAPAGARLLLVEDDVDLAEVLSLNLETRGFSVQVAHTLADARAALTATTPDMAIVDVVLPDGDGAALVRELCERPDAATRRVPVVLMTGHKHRDSDALRRIAPDSIEFMTKPFLPDALVKVLKLLGRG